MVQPSSTNLQNTAGIKEDSCSLATEGEPALLLLNERSFCLQDIQSRLQACDLGFETGLALSVGFGLLDALSLDLGEVLKDSIKLCLDTRAIGDQLTRELVQVLGLLDLEFHILHLVCPVDLIVLGDLLVFADRQVLVRGDLREVCCVWPA